MKPTHIGIILDGNRRLAKRLMMKPWKGHEWGVEKIKKLLIWAPELGIKELTLYTFSIENFNRPKEEFNYLMELITKSFNELDWKELQHKGIQIRVIGRTNMFPTPVKNAIKTVMQKTANNNKIIINFCMAYGGRHEIIDATKQIATEVACGKLKPTDINEEMFSKYLYLSDQPEMIIRTSGEQRTSDFLPYQAAYAEWFFIQKMWPEFEKEDLIACMNEYETRERRYGR